MFGLTEMATALNVSAITDNLGNYTVSGGGTVKALFQSNRVPEDMAAGIDSINYYFAGNIDMAAESLIAEYLINHRSSTFNDAVALAYNTVDVINRTTYPGFFITCEVLPPVGPQDSTDNYNVIISATLKKRGF